MKAKPLFFDVHTFLAKIGPGRTVISCRKNKRLFSQGDPADAIFYIQSGKVKLTVISKQGKEAVVGILGANDFFGEGCLAGQSVRMSSASAMSACEVMRLEKEHTIRVLHDEPTFSELFLTHLLAATFGWRRTWSISSSIRAKSDWRGYCSCSPTMGRKPNRSR